MNQLLACDLTIGEAIKNMTAVFTGLFESPREAKKRAQMIVSEAAGLDDFDLFLNFNEPLNEQQTIKLNRLAERCKAGEPVQYVVGKAYFRNIVLNVDRSVLIPRQETELIVDIVKDHCGRDNAGQYLIADIGCGSGAIALSVAEEIDGAEVFASDISGQALNVCHENAEKLRLTEKMRFLRGDLFEPFNGEIQFDVIIANLPYISEKEMSDLPDEIKKFEPTAALHGGKDGLYYIKRLIGEAPKFLKNGGLMVLEIGHNQSLKVNGILEAKSWQSIKAVNDYAGVSRFIVARTVADTAA
jgi:release factor glutamine methyltransferase